MTSPDHVPLPTLQDAIHLASTLLELYHVSPDDIRQYLRQHIKSERLHQAQAHADRLPELHAWAQRILATSAGRSVVELTQTKEIFVLLLCLDMDVLSDPADAPADTVALMPAHPADARLGTLPPQKRWWQFWK